MYLLSVVLLMFLLPFASIFAETALLKSGSGLPFLVAKWFVFWAGGVRLFTAGLRQALGPRYTAKEIFGITSPEPLVIVQELGFANLSIGLLGILSLVDRAWIFPAAITAGLFYGLAGFCHLARRGRNSLENIALISDLFAFCVMVGVVLRAILVRGAGI